MKSSAALFFAVIILFLSLTSCTEQKTPTCREIISAITESEIGLPAGKYYSILSPEGDDEYLSDSLLLALYGSSATPKISKNWIDYAVFLSATSSPCEFTAVCCRDRNTANDTAKLLSARLNVIKSTRKDTLYAPLLAQATVTVRGNFVLLIISSDTDAALSAAWELIK